jgi:RNA polymerase sigma-70 factor (ECF subfamily)
VSSHPVLATAPADFPALLAAHRGILLKVASSYAQGADDRADLIQDIALQLWRAWPGYDASRPFSTWMYRIALNVAISQLRRPRPVHEEFGAEHEHLVGVADVDAEARERLAMVQRAMQGFGAFDRALLLLHLEGCSQRESAEVLGTTETNVATRLGRIRQQLRRIDATATSPQGVIDGNA